MVSEISINIKNLRIDNVLSAFQAAFPKNDRKSAICHSKTYKNKPDLHSNFLFGYRNGNYLFLLSQESDELKMHVEPTARKNDPYFFMESINSIYGHAYACLKNINISIRTARCVIHVNNGFTITGEIPDWFSQFKTELWSQKYRLIIFPLTLALFSLITLVRDGDLKKIITVSLMPLVTSYCAVALWFVGEFLFKKQSKKFDFKLAK